MVMKLKNEEKINFVIDLFLNLDDYISGGLIALHKLAYYLADSGHNVYVFCKPAYEHENIHVIKSDIRIISGHKFEGEWEPFSFIFNKTVGIYPEHSRGNKFNTTNNVRWIMYHTTKEDELNFNENDYIFNFGNFKTYTNRNDGVLRVIDYNLDIFYNENKNREGYCFILGKETPENYEEIIKEYNPTNITYYKDQTDLNLLREQFNKYEYFITFDQKTYLTVAAALCGCKSIILNQKNRTKQTSILVNDVVDNAYTDSDEFKYNIKPVDYKLQNPENMFGVAYGIEDIEWANKTIHMVREHITNLDEMNRFKVQNFVKFWEKKLNISIKKKKKVNYFDLGLYKGEEIDMFLSEVGDLVDYKIYGFEAHPEYCEKLSQKYLNNDKINIINGAITTEENYGKDIKLFIENGHYNGQGNSVYDTKRDIDKNEYVLTKGISFVKWVRDNVEDYKDSYNILRFNIEGSELDLIEDILKNDFGKEINLYLGSKPGMDIQKVNGLNDKLEYFINLLEENKIVILPYCGEIKNNVSLKHLLCKDGLISHFKLYNF